MSVPAGVPQGFILGLFLFIIYMYINDMPESKNMHVALYADDTAIFAFSCSHKKASKYIQDYLNELQVYFHNW